MPGLGTTLGRGGATTTPRDLVRSDAILIVGSNMAENHPVAFQWVIEARERGARVIHVDPRFSRTSAMADTWIPIRAGSDIVLLGGLVRYAIEEGLVFLDYVRPYTNASVILREDMRDTEDLDGVFSGWDPSAAQYDATSWQYARDRRGEYLSDPTLQHPRCVYQVLRRHFARYTPEMVERVCGVPRARFVELAAAFCGASGPEKTGAICYALGWTQHSKGSQLVRTAAILQLLLGNIGRPGGGIMALRGHASIQGSTDIPTLFDLLPGYIAMPRWEIDPDALPEYLRERSATRGMWANLDRYLVSLLKAYYGAAATPANDFGFRWLPRLTGDHSHMAFWLEMADGNVEGLFAIGDNPAVAGPNAGFERRALAKLKWMVVRDLVETETASFWYDSPEVRSGAMRTADIETEVFLMPAAGHAEKDGTFTNTERLLQFREKAVDPPGDARSESWFIHQLGRRLQARALADPRPRHAGLIALTLDGADGGSGEPAAEDVLREINGYRVADRSLVPGFTALAADGSTACGCWIYSGVFPADDRNRARERRGSGQYGHGWGFAWPADRRVLYNRASARPDGTPWSDRKTLVWWDANRSAWTGLDVPDFPAATAPDYTPPPEARGAAALAGDKPFVMHDDGLGWIWVPTGLNDGPLPAHYEPFESPVANAIYPSQPTNPAAMKKERPGNLYAASPDPQFPYVLTTYRLTEHHTTGAMTRVLPHLAELQPALFCEISPELAAARGIGHGADVEISTARGLVRARAMVTPRMRPLFVDGRTVHQVGLPWHWGYRGLTTGDVANDLTAISEEPNSRIMEAKALLCNIRCAVGQPSDRAAEP